MAGVFIGDDGYTLVEIDLNGAENWASAMIAGDDAMAAACASSDFHSSMAAGYFGERWQQADKDERKRLRRMGKSITFGTAYGMGRKKLALTLGITEQEAQGILDAKNRVFWATAEAKQAAQTKAETVGYINLWSGRQVPVDPDQSYTAWDYLAQGAVAELVKRAIVLIMGLYRERKMKSYIASEVHDSLILAVHHSEWDQAIFIAKMMMESVIPDDLNNRTTPPIQWIAEPDFEGNAKKWGKGQHHPEPKQEVQIPTLPTEPASQEVPEIVFSVPSLNFEWRGRARPRIN
jgi:DNA polymerase-1